MRLQDWEATIRAITEECRRDRSGADRVLIAWRARLEEEPHHLQSYQIDEIVREARHRLTQVTGNAE